MKKRSSRGLFLMYSMLLGFLISASCVPPRLNVSTTPTLPSELIKTIALAPSGGVLADAIGFELIKYGFDVFDTSQLSNLMVRLNLNEVEVMQPQNLSLLKHEGIDCLLYVRSVAGYDGRPQSATVKITTTTTGRILVGATWQNGRAGAQGSPADQDARVDMVQAAQQIAKGIALALGGAKNASR